MQQPALRHCRLALKNDAVHKYVSNLIFSTSSSTQDKASTSHLERLWFRSIAHTRCFGTSARSNSTISAENIFRSHLPDMAIPDNVPFHQFLFEKCDEHAHRTALTEFLTGRSYTYSQLKENSVRVASALHRLGFRKGDVVTSFSSNNIDISVLMLACASLGLVYSAANPTFTADDLSRQLEHSGSLAVFTVPQLADTVKGALANGQFQHKVKNVFVFGKSPGFQPFENLLEDNGKAFPDVDINAREDVFALPYSSGTTGLPKGVMLTHYNILANCVQMNESVRLGVEEHVLGLLPLYHIYGMVIMQYCALGNGSHLITLPKFDPEDFLQCLQDAKIETANLVPSIINFLAKHPVVSKYDLTSLRRIFCAAAPLGEGVTREFLQRHTHGVKLAQGYGLTETSPATNVDTSYKAYGSIGTLLVNTLGKVIDLDTKRSLGPGEQGEYCIKGPQVMKGYLNNQKATEEMVQPDGWLHTGDIGYYTKEGNVYITDRIKELIKYKGSQVPPAELEALLLEHESIADVAVVGVPDERAGELPKAFVVRKNKATVTEEDIVDFVKGKMAPSKRLHGGVQFVKEIPRNASGKILRREIKEKYVKKLRD